MTQRTKIIPKEVQMWKITGFQALAIEEAKNKGKAFIKEENIQRIENEVGAIKDAVETGKTILNNFKGILKKDGIINSAQ